MPAPQVINGAKNIFTTSRPELAADTKQRGQATGVSNTLLTGPSSQTGCHGSLYAPFASEDMVMLALGKNMTRDVSGKPSMSLIARNDEDRVALDKINGDSKRPVNSLN